MDHFAGLDVSVKETSVCIVNDTGRIVREVKVASEPEALLAVLKNPAYHFERIGLAMRLIANADAALRQGLRVMVGLSAEQFVGYLIDRKEAPDVEGIVRSK